ncbi:LOW QUALITY PROTEIN: leucine-rich repeat-containing protein 42-like [Tachypleus tridentatus]|uniref:LOW QUALITY PROTEIN: leucine-rich repeat-containing protein 42-like n=1 Tax=Tachypleus tridentatus TaxID=6853 RepID=UPI003FD53299
MEHESFFSPVIYTFSEGHFTKLQLVRNETCEKLIPRYRPDYVMIRNETVKHQFFCCSNLSSSLYSQFCISCSSLKPAGDRKRGVESKSSVPTLFSYSLNFIAKNILNVESLIGFPDVIGEILFKLTAHLGAFTGQEVIITKLIQLFVDAYKEQVLSSLWLRKNLLMINEYCDPIIQLTHYVIDLDLTSCHLGDGHDLISHIRELKRLQRLVLADNNLTDRAVRLLTLPCRMYARGSPFLHYLDLSFNKGITNASIRWLMCYKDLRFLDLTETSITPLGVFQIKQKLELQESSTKEESSIETKGWAEEVVKQWHVDTETNYIKKTSHSKTSGLFSLYPVEKPVRQECSFCKLITAGSLMEPIMLKKKVPSLSDIERSTKCHQPRKKCKISNASSGTNMDIEELYNQYRYPTSGESLIKNLDFKGVMSSFW